MPTEADQPIPSQNLSEILPLTGNRSFYFATASENRLIFYPNTRNVLKPEEVEAGNRCYEALNGMLNSWGMDINIDPTTHLPHIRKDDQPILEPGGQSDRVSIELLLNKQAVYISHVVKKPFEGETDEIKIPSRAAKPYYSDRSIQILYDGQSYSKEEYQALPAVQNEIKRLNSKATVQFLEDRGITISLQPAIGSRKWNLAVNGQYWPEPLQYGMEYAEEGDITGAFTSFKSYDEMGSRLYPNFYIIIIGKYLAGNRPDSKLIWRITRSGAEKLDEDDNVHLPTMILTRSIPIAMPTPNGLIPLSMLSALTPRVTFGNQPALSSIF